MIDIQLFHFLQIALTLLKTANAMVAEGHHVLAMYGVVKLQVTVPDKEIGKRNGKVVHLHGVEKMLLSVGNQTIEDAVGLAVFTEFAPSQSRIEDFVGCASL